MACLIGFYAFTCHCKHQKQTLTYSICLAGFVAIFWLYYMLRYLRVTITFMYFLYGVCKSHEWCAWPCSFYQCAKVLLWHHLASNDSLRVYAIDKQSFYKVVIFMHLFTWFAKNIAFNLQLFPSKCICGVSTFWVPGCHWQTSSLQSLMQEKRHHCWGNCLAALGYWLNIFTRNF